MCVYLLLNFAYSRSQIWYIGQQQSPQELPVFLLVGLAASRDIVKSCQVCRTHGNNCLYVCVDPVTERSSLHGVSPAVCQEQKKQMHAGIGSGAWPRKYKEDPSSASRVHMATAPRRCIGCIFHSAVRAVQSVTLATWRWRQHFPPTPPWAVLGEERRCPHIERRLLFLKDHFLPQMPCDMWMHLSAAHVVPGRLSPCF